MDVLTVTGIAYIYMYMYVLGCFRRDASRRMTVTWVESLKNLRSYLTQAGKSCPCCRSLVSPKQE